MSVPKTATTDDAAAGYWFQAGRKGADVMVDTNTFDDTARTITLSLTGLDNALYRVRVNSLNPNSADPARSEWSAAIGTGEA